VNGLGHRGKLLDDGLPAPRSSIVYSTFGEVTSETQNGYSPFMKYTGKPFDVVTGLQYSFNRWYDAATGRWISEDPIGFGGGDANLSRYVGNSPTNHGE
jgi:RHS repeat-associated protein